MTGVEFDKLMNSGVADAITSLVDEEVETFIDAGNSSNDLSVKIQRVLRDRLVTSDPQTKTSNANPQ